MAGITGGDPRQLEVDSTFPQWVAWERDHGSLVRGAFRERTQPPAGMPSGTFTVQGGVQTLIDALATQLGASLRLATPALSATFTPGRVAVDTPAGRFDAERLVIAAPPAVARQLLPDAPSGWLDDPPTAPLAAIHLGYPSLPSPPSGFGWLVHPRERRDALGCLWVSSTFPGHAPRGATLLRLMVGGARAPELAAQPDDALVDHARRVVAEVQGVHDTPALVHVRRTPIPQYPVGTARRLRLLHRVRPNVHFVGWWWGHMGIAAAAQGAADLVHALRGR